MSFRTRRVLSRLTAFAVALVAGAIVFDTTLLAATGMAGAIVFAISVMERSEAELEHARGRVDGERSTIES